MSIMALHFFFMLLLCAFPTAKAQSLQLNISSGSILFTNSTPNFWPSRSGHFAFGFYPSGNGFKIGIWIVGSPKNTIVWTVWRDDPVIAPGAALLFSSEDGLLLRSSLGHDRVIAQTTQRASVASMHDMGNFVLYNSSMNPIWASFTYPSDTLLVGQKLVPESFLYSSVSEMDHSTGDFKLRMLENGILNAYPMKSSYEGKYLYWSSGRTSGDGNVSLTLAKGGRLYLQNSSGFSNKNLSEGGNVVNDMYLYRATFDVDGILRLYQHQMGANGSFNVSILWSMIKEEDQCSVLGICGINSYCTMNGSNVTCICLPSFDFLDPKQPRKGCILNNTLGECSLANVTEMSVLDNTQWERNEYDVLTPMNEQACSRACLEDCNCVVATYGSQICYKQKLPLRFGKKISTNPTKILVKTRKGSSLGDPTIDDNVPPNKIAKKKQLGKEILIGGVVLITFSLIVFLSSGYLIYRHQLWSLKISSRHASSSEVLEEEIILRSFSYDQIVEATDDFKEEIGRGASGRVFKGVFADYGGREVAVKKLEKLAEDGEYEFMNEMKIIGRTHHKNLVQLIGFCNEGSNRLLVYELMKNGSLGDLLFKAKKRPSWKERVRILVEIAEGLHYLHEECETRIIHCDIKPHNVLMDESWRARISDFGLSKLLKPEQTRTYTIPRGTRGYAAPEWYKNNTPITVKSDVYSFGILLLEIICCRKNMDVTVSEEEVILLDWVYECYEARELRKVVGEKEEEEEEEVDMEEFEKILKVGLLCVQPDPTSRPAMKTVVLMLEGTVGTPLPPSLHAHSSMC